MGAFYSTVLFLYFSSLLCTSCTVFTLFIFYHFCEVLLENQFYCVLRYCKCFYVNGVLIMVCKTATNQLMESVDK